MPEIKHQFTGGKMNKDVDERLVPNGEYRDAMNIQVSTSEGSDVGTVQNILGNHLVCYGGSYNAGFTAGSISDEKNDALYWLVSGQDYQPSDFAINNNDWTELQQMSDSIWRHTTNGGCQPVFVDKYAFSQLNDNDSDTDLLSSISPEAFAQIEDGWTVTGVNTDGTTSNTVVIQSTNPTNPIYVDYAFTTESTGGLFDGYIGPNFNPMVTVGNEIRLPVIPIFGGGYELANSNTVYISSFTGDPAAVVGNNIEILTNAGQISQTFEIQSAVVFDMSFDGGASIQVVLKLTLTTITDFDTVLLDQPTNFGETSDIPYISEVNGDKISGIISITTGGTVDIATGELMVDSTVDVSDYEVGQSVLLQGSAFVGTSGLCIHSISTVNNSITLEDCLTGDIFDGWQVGGFINYAIQADGGIILIGGDSTVLLNENIDLSDGYESLLFSGPRTLNFNHGEYITGINIIDSMLFWTDGKTEPKKINIPRSIEGTDNSGDEHTRLINNALNIDSNSNILAREKHITVIRKAPLKAPFLDMKSSSREGIVSGENLFFENSGFSFSGTVIGGLVGGIVIDDIDGEAPDFKVGDTLVLAAEQSSLPDNYDLKVSVVEIDFENDPDSTTYTFKMESEDFNGVAASTLLWYVELVESESLFQRKLPRFAYRYKYEDNEYSSFSPFTQVAFIPSKFNYEPIKAYNEGMINNVKSLTIKDFIPIDIPLDVVQVDILYKNEINPTVYLLKSITPNDNVLPGEGSNSWNSVGSSLNAGGQQYYNADKGSYKVSSENISHSLSSSQSLRVWDNVPKKAKAQEITGNRVVYGNYETGYSSIQPQITASLNSRVIEPNIFLGKKSIKSLRDYDIGVVWGDKYGRETPVKTAGNSIAVLKTKASNSSYLTVGLENSPSWADYYRFYIKETSNEYYNLAMDRMYDAADGNVWLSFPSIDRNKVDDDTYIILKKGADTSTLVEDKGRYKIVAIENEAPEYIKTSFELLVRTNTDDSRSKKSCMMYGGSHSLPYPNCNFNGRNNAPEPGRKGFSLHADHWNFNGYSTIPPIGMQLTPPRVLFDEVRSNENGSNTDELYVSFTREVDVDGITQILGDSEKYHVVNVDAGVDGGDHHYISLDSLILPEDVWITNHHSTDPAISLGWRMAADDIHVHFWKKTIVNKPEFDGRFFVKILNDSVVDNNVIPQQLDAKKFLRTTTSIDLYKVEDPILTITSQPGYDFTGNYSPTSATAGALTGEDFKWAEILKFGGSAVKPSWFIDHATFAGQQRGSGSVLDPQDSYTGFDLGGVARHSCDYTSTISNHYETIHCNVIAEPDFFNNTNTGSGRTNACVGMKGTHYHNNANYIDISYSTVGPNGPAWGVTPNGGAWNTGLNWDINQDDVIGSLGLNKQFKLEGSDIIYKILQVNKFRLFNHQGKNTAPNVGFDQPTDYMNDTAAAAIGGWCDFFWNDNHRNQITRLQKSTNRRFTYRIKYEADMTYSPDGTSADAAIDDVGQPFYNINNAADQTITPTSNKLSFLTSYNIEGENPISDNPAIFETEPKEEVDIDIYYEASSSIPTLPLNNRSKYSFIPLGSTLVNPNISFDDDFEEGIFITAWGQINIANPVYEIYLSAEIPNTLFDLFEQQPIMYVEKDNGEIIGFKILSGIEQDDGNIIGFEIQPQNQVGLNWFNCWSFGNGVESNRIGDTYNKPYVTNGVTASSSTEELEETVTRKYGLIYSGLYNSTSSVNNLNQFIAAEKITKDINPTYGSIQKLHSGWGQGGDLVALCEDRIIKILANKDALFNADGNTNITSTNNVLGTATPYSGEYGISKNPESFAADAYRVYFTDKVRSTVMRLSKDGLTVISDYGMKDWFRDNLKLSTKLIGSFDDRNDEYNITIKKPDYTQDGFALNDTTTVSFKENVKGWVSFKSFTPINAISCANEYFSFKGNALYKHHSESEERNTFYTVYKSSRVSVILNEAPGSVKSFQTVNYEGSQARVLENLDEDSIVIDDGQYYNLVGRKGWYVDSENGLVAAETDLEKGSVSEFIKKEGKWFAYFTGVDTNVNALGQVVGAFDSASFSMQGVGKVASIQEMVIMGCTGNGDQPNGAGEIDNQFNTDYPAFNYNPSATVDDGTCIEAFYGCMDPTADNYFDYINTDDGSCVWWGCLDPNANNYDDTATVADGSCTYTVLGCTDPAAFNYDATANTDDNSCIAVVNGCMDLLACNFDSTANTDDGSCMTTYGCTDVNASNYDATVECDDGSCTPCVYGCTDDTQFNFTFLATCDDGSCIPVIFGCIDSAADNLNEAGSYLYNAAGNYVPNANTDDGSCVYSVYGCTDPLLCNYDPLATVDDGGCISCGDPNAMELIPLGNSGYDTCTDGCVYCTTPLSMNIIQDFLPDGAATIVWETIDSAHPQIADAVNYKIYLDGALYATLVPGSMNYSVNPDGTNHNFYIDGLTANQSYTISIVKNCGANNNPAIVSNLLVDAFDPVFGCTDDTGANNPGPGTHGACNYDPLADTDDGSCDYDYCYGCTDVTADNYDIVFTVDDGSCFIGGCMDDAFCEYDAGATVDDGSCDAAIVYGCTFSTMFNYNPLACVNDGSCEPFTYGCTNPAADNYNSAINSDDGSCIWFGCTDPLATNYDPIATIDDGTCDYTPLLIGDTHQGGIVFYLYANGGGLVVSTSNQHASAPFGCPNLFITGTLFGIGDGQQNTTNILAQCADPNSTAALASNNGVGWHLPSRDELNEMHIAVGKGADASVLNSNGDTTFNIANLNGQFWSSNQNINFDAKAWGHNFNTDSQFSMGSKINGNKVRAIKSF